MIVVNLKKSKRIVSRALLAFAAINIVVNFSVLNEASMKFLPTTTVISDRRFQADLSLKRLSRRLSQEKDPPQDTKDPSSDKKDAPKELPIPFCTWKDSNATVGDIFVNQSTEAKHFHNFAQAYEEQQYLPLCPEHSPLLRGRTDVYQGNITWEQAQVNKTVRFSPL